MEAVSSQLQPAAPSPRFNLVFGLLCRCPAIRQEDCLLAQKRQLPMRLRYEWARSLSEAQLERIYQHHHRCLQRQSLEQRIPVRIY